LRGRVIVNSPSDAVASSAAISTECREIIPRARERCPLKNPFANNRARGPRRLRRFNCSRLDARGPSLFSPFKAARSLFFSKQICPLIGRPYWTAKGDNLLARCDVMRRSYRDSFGRRARWLELHNLCIAHADYSADMSALTDGRIHLYRNKTSSFRNFLSKIASRSRDNVALFSRENSIAPALSRFFLSSFYSILASFVRVCAQVRSQPALASDSRVRNSRYIYFVVKKRSDTRTHARMKIYALCASSNNLRKQDTFLVRPSPFSSICTRTPICEPTTRGFIRGMIGERAES